MPEERKETTMRFEGGETTAVVRAVVRRVRDQNLTFLAGSLAYNAFVSLIPLLLLILFVVGTVGSEVFATRVSDLTEAYLTAGAQQEIQAAVDNAGGEVGLSVTGFVVLLWGALKLFRGLDTAFAEVYETERDPNIVKQFRDGLVALAVLGLSLVSLALAGTAFAYFRLPLLHILNPLLLLGGLSLAFLPMYYVFPDVEMTVRAALPGAVVAAGGWAILEVGFQVYASYAGQYEAYGVIGGILLLLTWLYFGGFVLLVGAAVNAVVRERELGRLDAGDAGTTGDGHTRGVTRGGDDAVESPTEPRPSVASAGTSAAPTDEDGENRVTAPDGPAERTHAAGSDAGAAARTVARRTRKGGTQNGRDDGPLRGLVAAFAVGVVVGLVAVVAAAVRFAR